jgi:hypothetical protein
MSFSAKPTEFANSGEKLMVLETHIRRRDAPPITVLADPVYHAFRKQRALTTIRTVNEAPHLIPR